MIDVELLREHISYDPVSGRLVCEKDFGRKHKAGDTVGTISGTGYVGFYFGGRYVLGHRAAWALYTGDWPLEEVDHKDGNRSNNALANLRQASHAENMQNRPVQKNNKSGIPGVRQSSSGRWCAEIESGGKRIWVGRFSTRDEAANACAAARKRHHAFQPVQRGIAAWPPPPKSRRT